MQEELHESHVHKQLGHVACMLKDEADLVTHSCRGLAFVGSP